MNLQIDINCDLGEGFGNYKLSNESEIMPLVSSCNVACGFHAGDPNVIAKTIKLAIENNVLIGAHPSFPDLKGFGRRVIQMDPEELHNSVLYQVGAIKGMVEAMGSRLNHVKPHGALYNYSTENEDVTWSVYEAVKKIDPKLIIYGLPNTLHEKVADQLQIPFKSEGFADRKYGPDGRLISRKLKGSMLTSPEEVVSQVLKLIIHNKVDAFEGGEIFLHVETMCVHGDNPNAVKVLKHIQKALKENNIQVA